MTTFAYIAGVILAVVVTLAVIESMKYEAWKDRHLRALDPVERFSFASATENERKVTWNAKSGPRRRAAWMAWLILALLLDLFVAVVAALTLLAMS